jgi:predicted secreted protein
MATDLTLHQSDSGRTLRVGIGTKFRLDLDENRTTGYSWSQPEFDAAILSLESDDVVPAPGVGGAGSRRFTWLVNAAGRTTVSLAYKRAWEQNAAASSRFDVTIASA